MPACLAVAHRDDVPTITTRGAVPETEVPMYTRMTPRDTTIAQASFLNAMDIDGDVHYLRVVRDGDRAEDVYAFLWATTDVGADPYEVEWGEHWRGNLRACMRNFAEVAEDLAAEPQPEPSVR